MEFAAERTIPGAIERSAARHASREALVENGVRVSYDALLERVREAAGGLIAAGLHPGATVALWAPNSVEWAIASLAVLFAGGTVVPLNTRYTASEAADIVIRARCRFVLASGPFLGRSLAAEAVAMTSAQAGVPTVVTFDREAASGAVLWTDLVRAGGSGAEVESRLRALTPDHISHLQFTSGTTGRPKGAKLRHEPMVVTTAEWAAVVGVQPGDRYPVVSPFSHIGGHKTGLLASLLSGATVYPFATLDLDRLVATIASERATVLQGPPTMYYALISAARVDPEGFASLRVGVTGGATVPPTLVREMLDVLGLTAVLTSYGLTETTGVCTITRRGDAIEIIAGTSGRPITGVDVAVAAPDGTPLATNEQGEILVRGFNLMAGYLDDPAATDEAIRDGWLHTGDIGWIGDDGNLRIVDRLKDMIIVGGLNAYPAEIERVLLEHPDIEQAAVVGVADDRLGEVPAAYVVSANDLDEASSGLLAFCRDRLANFKMPRHVWRVEALPLNSAGKVQKPALRDDAARRLAGSDARS
jgi:acyl-CoA synthetase (AMP-forming)/AMP-acid ligase II